VRKEHLHEAGKRVRLKDNIQLLYQLLEAGIDGHFFDFYVLSAAPVEVIYSALEGIVPQDHIYGTRFVYKPSGEIDHRAGDRGLRQSGGARPVAQQARSGAGPRDLQRRWQL
jgi:hypothetical protein